MSGQKTNMSTRATGAQIIIKSADLHQAMHHTHISRSWLSYTPIVDTWLHETLLPKKFADDVILMLLWDYVRTRLCPFSMYIDNEKLGGIWEQGYPETVLGSRQRTLVQNAIKTCHSVRPFPSLCLPKWHWHHSHASSPFSLHFHVLSEVTYLNFSYPNFHFQPPKIIMFTAF